MELGSNILHQFFNGLEVPFHIWPIDSPLDNIFVNVQIQSERMSEKKDFCHFAETDPFRLVYDVRLIDDVFDQTGIADSLRPDFGGSNRKKKTDNRQHKRFQLNENAIIPTR